MSLYDTRTPEVPRKNEIFRNCFTIENWRMFEHSLSRLDSTHRSHLTTHPSNSLDNSSYKWKRNSFWAGMEQSLAAFSESTPDTTSPQPLWCRVILKTYHKFASWGRLRSILHDRIDRSAQLHPQMNMTIQWNLLRRTPLGTSKSVRLIEVSVL